MESEVISVRVKKGTKKRLGEAGIDVPREINRYLDELLTKEERRRALDELVLIIKMKVKPSKKGWAVKSLREDRYEGH